MNILVFEYAVGGGFKKEIDPWILAEGYAMFSTVASGFKKAGHKVVGLVDNRFYALKFLDEQIKVEPGKHLEKLKNATKECDIDAVFVIAPESNSELYFASKVVEDNDIVLLGSSSEGIKTTSIKAHTYRILKNKVPLPPTKITTFKLTEAKLAVKEVGGYPVVVKSVDGVACSGLSFVKNDAQLLQALIKTNKISKFQYCLVQKYLEGIHASVSLICNGHSAFPLSLNQQFIKLNLPEAESKYFGGLTPLEHRDAEYAKKIAKKAVEAIKGLKGFVGVDLVLTKNSPVVIEINARTTTPIPAIERVTSLNVAKLILDSVIYQKLPEKVDFKGCAAIAHARKSEISYGIELIAPPYSTEDIMILTTGSTLNEVEAIKNRYLSSLSLFEVHIKNLPIRKF